VDKFKILIIPDEAAAIDAMRQGKIDALDQISIERAQALQKTNPEILQIMTPSPSTPSIDPRNDLPPFNDIRVRKAYNWQSTCRLSPGHTTAVKRCRTLYVDLA